MKQKKLGREWRYLQIARGLEQQIHRGVLKVGEKLPSVRMICRQQGVSMSTAQAAFYELEAKSLVTARPQSGYYVNHSALQRLGLPGTSRPRQSYHQDSASGLFESAREKVREKNFTLFSHGVPDTSLLPVAKLNKSLLEAARGLADGGTDYEPLAGSERLRRQISRWSFHWQGHLVPDDIITTAGCISAISYSLMALTNPGDKIAVESPCFYGILQLARRLGLRLVELPTHPQTGVEPEALKKAIRQHRISACLFSANFNNPLGSLMPDEHKKEAVRLLTQHRIPLIEDDIYGDLYFGERRPTCCKSFDDAGIVMLCSSVSKTLAPGYRVGWVVPGESFKDAIGKIKLYHNLSGTALTHEAIARFLEVGRYEAHLRKLRRTLHTQYLNSVRVIGESFPDGTRISRPQGGLSLWVELPRQIDATLLYEDAFAKKITFSPGPLFTLQKQFRNCMRLTYGLAWNEKTESSLRILGKLATHQLSGH